MLTKSKFKLASECPTKLSYVDDKRYENTSMDDSFLEALADGGYQVGELVKSYYPEGISIETLDKELSLAQTNELLKRDNVTIFEAAIQYGSMFIRVDMLKKQGNKIELYEVKAKSYDMSKDGDFKNKTTGYLTGWLPYLLDIAFQWYVTKQAFPQSTIDCFLTLVDKKAVAKTDGINQKFKITEDKKSRKHVVTCDSLTQQDLSANFLTHRNVMPVITDLFEGENAYTIPNCPGDTLEQNINQLANLYEQQIRISPVIGSKCKKCEFRVKSKPTLKDGFKECWKEELRWNDEDFAQPTVLDIWNYRKADALVKERRIHFKDLTKDDFNLSVGDTNIVLSPKERQWLQVEKHINNDTTAFFDSDGLKKEMATWQWPLHMIDFETNTVALPFFKGMHPYETIAFQFSHHIIHQNGRVEHAGEFLNTTPGDFPNFAFIRALKAQLQKDHGSIFRYSNHENTVLCAIHRQLEASDDADKNELMAFIETITNKKDKKKGFLWCGDRNMIDLWDLVKKYYYDPATQGSNSIKAVLPVVLNQSQLLQEKYAKPVYGTNEITSINFDRFTWLKRDLETGSVIDPYKQLPRMFDDIDEHDIELLSGDDELNNGGLALTAYAKCQFTDMSDYERTELERGLLKYCELDTLAMVMIVEAWLDWTVQDA
ncbi:DUF2779 domain-containing protein [Alteromonas mediterranea]|uniref:DUF2779 domain-containing protein n=1 Tax=Alteromonas mediterranea TaxID=314275 RepID=UPI001130EA69|nr:DUF2779 domain-containing protein [Alteromonas mediterranea]QDG39542.1 DUF2779 domain-containing protein [Alteromonas mediterranea]